MSLCSGSLKDPESRAVQEQRADPPDSSADREEKKCKKEPEKQNQLALAFSIHNKQQQQFAPEARDFYSCRLIGKLTTFLQLQEFSQRNLPVEDSFTFAARLSFLG
jgi:hypothetical protein